MNNRRGLDDAMNAQFAFKTRYNASFSWRMFDIDHFKQVNDQRGHLHGDHVLAGARPAVRRVGPRDRHGRPLWRRGVRGGHAAHGPGRGRIFAERLRARVAEQCRLPSAAAWRRRKRTTRQEGLIARADAALYSAKTAGRNCVFCHTGADPEPIAVEKDAADAAAVAAPGPGLVPQPT